MARLVTGYLRLDLGHRGHERFVELGKRLLALGAPTTAFVDPHAPLGAPPPGVEVVPASLADCWLWPLAQQARLPPGDPAKDTLAFHAACHQKSAWLTQAVATCDDDLLVWLDFGVLHVAGVTERGVRHLLARVERRAPRDRITLASIWGPPTAEIAVDRVQWFCAGGVVICPRPLAAWWDAEVRRTARALLAAGNVVTWEVNVWAMVWARHPERFRHYLCDHDASLVDAGP